MRPKVKFHVGLALAYTLTTLLLISGVIGYLFASASNLAVETATRAMARAAEDIEISVDALFRPAARSVRATAFLLENEAFGQSESELTRLMLRQIKAQPEVASLFVAFADKGRFLQVVRGGDADADALKLRMLEEAPGVLLERPAGLNNGGEGQVPIAFAEAFDPRLRPWYENALEVGTLTLSEPYIFASTGEMGLTVSQVAREDSGRVIGVAGADITLRGLADYLGQKRIGDNGRAFILGQDDQLIVVSHPETMDSGDEQAILRDEVEEAILHFRETGETQFINEGARPIMASFRPFPPEFGKSWTIGVLADRREMVGGIRDTVLQTIVVSLVYTLLAIGVMVLLSRRITQPLRQIAAETDRIRDFRLENPFSLRSWIFEIDNLSQSVSSMKAGLQGFKAFVPVELVQSVLASGTAVGVGGESREVTMMFSDIEAFSSRTEALPSDVVFEDLSRYFGQMSEIVQAHNGTVDKFIGDAVMALWNAPQRDPDHVVNACRAALACRDMEVAQDADDGKDLSLFPVKTRFGLHTGDVIVGNVGSNQRLQYTALGKEVNLAARLESLNKQYGTYLLVSERVADRIAGRFHLRLVDLATPVGTTEPLRIYELLDEVGQGDEADARRVAFCEDWEACMADYTERRWGEAAATFSDFAMKHRNDPVARLYVERCTQYQTAPPPADWNGVHVHTEK